MENKKIEYKVNYEKLLQKLVKEHAKEERKKAKRKLIKLIEMKQKEWEIADDFAKKLSCLLEVKTKNSQSRSGIKVKFTLQYAVIVKGMKQSIRKEACKKYGVYKFQHKYIPYTLYFATNRERLENFAKMRLGDYASKIINLWKEGLVITPYCFRYQRRFRRDEEKKVKKEPQIHFTLKPDPEIVLAWKQMECETVLQKRVLNNLDFRNLRWAVFSRLKRCVWRGGMLRDIEEAEKDYLYKFFNSVEKAKNARKKYKYLNFKKMLNSDFPKKGQWQNLRFENGNIVPF